ncbi:MAG: insulinase family protein, partial [Betaproteobacteria bacterium]|nr:insulinase family protein [Betaproteobacteria bacterium]
GRLHKALVESGKAAQVAGFPYYGLDSTLQLFIAVVKKGEAVEPVRDEIIKVVEDFYKNAPSKEEMDRVRVNSIKQSEQILNNHERIGVALSEYIALGDWRLFFYGRDLVEKINPEQVTQAAATYFKRDNRTVGYFLPEDAPQRAELPAVPAVADVLKDFKPKVAAAQAEVFDPSNANIDKRTKRLTIEGIKVALLQKKNRGETVNVSLRFHTGDEKNLFGKQTIASIAGQMLPMGTSQYSRTQLADEYNKLKVSGGVDGLNGRFQTTKPNVAAAIRLAAHTMREATFPEAEFEQLRKLALTGIESQQSDPAALSGIALNQHFNIHPKGDWRYAGTLQEAAEEVKALKLEDIKAFHRTYYGANQGEIAIVGDFDEKEVTAAITEAFAGWKTQIPYQRLVEEYRDIKPVNQSIETPDKENAAFRARINVDMNQESPDFPALYLANYILGGGAGLNSRLAERIRQKEGLSYGVGSGLSVDVIDRSASWSVQAIAAPQNIAKVEAAFMDELAKALKDGFTPAEIAAAKSGALQQRQQARAQDGNLSGAILNNLYFGRDFAKSQAFEDKLSALKPEDVLAALRKHIDPAKLTIIKAGDFAKLSKASAAAK